MSTPLMKCGHSAQGTVNGKVACGTCAGIRPGFDEIETSPPSMEGRLAKCGCGRTEPSSPALAFFEYCGPGSPKLVITCGNCAYYLSAHTPEAMERNKNLKCGDFVPHAPYEFDRYYCGCRGWD